MGANEKSAAAYHGRTDTTIAEASAAMPAPNAEIIGFLVQCETCPQRALIIAQVGAWVCPACAEVVEPLSITVKRWLPGDPVETGHDIGLTHAAELFPQHQRQSRPASIACPHQDIRYGVCADCGEYPDIAGVTA